ncbi:SCO family protein [Nocardioides panacisoli]|uniref:SCO family protein n=1 Tax=Nocardioides panacisoli TaxID=627624 RepID=A0ABP7IN69_9ACTN
MRSVLAAVLVALSVVMSACGGPQEFTGARLDQPYTVPDVPLTATDGSTYSLAKDTDKPLTLVFFGYTHCPDLCPLVMSSLSAGLNQLNDADRAKVDMVFVTTDPARDDEAALRSYLDKYGEGFIGLTGPLEDIVRLGEPMHLYVSDGKKLPGGGYDLGGHTTAVLGIGTDHEVHTVWTDKTSASAYADDIRTLLDEDS